ncbi:ABC transporter substrate-binding protein [Ornithinibacillus sp. 4-3]|uniref:ABC transporter substrate-binding protein n=1 Tax=Ornithinibacillus sp. 4-3 TaxID=3231488 RepID=A0AB39HSA9_9BACI
MKKQYLLLLATIFALFLIVAGCSSESEDDKDSTTDDSGETAENEDEQEEAKGGELRVALSAQPANLDQPMSTNTSTRDVSRLIFETLLTTNSKFEPVPMLAESYDISEDGLVYTFKLREGIKFHNGEEMDSEDVVASMERWLEVSTITGSIFENSKFEATDKYVVELTLQRPYGLAAETLASTKMAPAIMPKEIIENVSDAGVTEYIGTGPFKMEEWRTDQYIHLTKFEDYQALDEEPDGLAGKKEALVDDIYFEFVSDAATRLAGLQTGEYDVGYAFPFDNYEMLDADEETESILEGAGELVLIYNKSEGLASNFKMRQAINAALDIEKILLTAFTNEDLYVMSSSYMNRYIEKWVSEAGSEFWNINDPELAKELLEEAGYDGEEFILMTTRDYPHIYNAAVVVQEQLSNIGMNVSLEVYDWPTLADKQNKPGEWDAFVNGLTPVTTPPQLNHINPTYSRGVQSDEILDMMKQLEEAPTFEESREIWDEIQGYAWEHHLPVTNFGGYHSLYGARTNVSGFHTFHGGVFWNVSVDK